MDTTLDEQDRKTAQAVQQATAVMRRGDLPGARRIARAARADGLEHPVLIKVVARWLQHAQPPSQIALANLTVAGMSEMTGQMLRLARPPFPRRRGWLRRPRRPKTAPGCCHMCRRSWPTAPRSTSSSRRAKAPWPCRSPRQCLPCLTDASNPLKLWPR